MMQVDRILISVNYYLIMRFLAIVTLIILLFSWGQGLIASGDIKLFPNTQNSPSIYVLPFTLSKAIPSKSYILVTMDWYTTSLTPYNCILVNTSITVACTNLVTPTFPLTITTTQILKFNSKLSTAKTVAVLVNSNLLPDTQYALQLHLFNVIPNIQKISPSIEMYTVSYNGLIYEANPNFGAVINNLPLTNLMGVSILNDLSANSPGSTSTLRAQVTIGQAITTSQSTFIFVMQFPFTFSIGSIPTVSQSSLFSTNPIPLYSAPSISFYQITSPNVFTLVFNQKFVVGRKFIVQISQINNPYLIASANISIYSLNFNTLTPLQAFEMLYPITTVSYPLAVSLGLPYNAPIQGPMNFYQYLWQYVQVSFTIPYSVPQGYSIRIQLLNAQIFAGSGYSNFHSLVYTPVYRYSTNFMIVSSMGPIPIGTAVTISFQINIQTATLFYVYVFIDTEAVITAYTAPKFVYSGLKQENGISSSNSFFNNFYDLRYWQGERVMSTPTISNTQWFQLLSYQNIGLIATSAGSYIDYYFSPYVIISGSFNQNTDCQLYQSTFSPTWTSNACLVTITQTSTYLRLTIKANSNYLTTVSNFFPFQSYSYIRLRNIAFTMASTNRNVFPVYCALYKSDVVNPVTYYYMRNIHAMPDFGTLSGVNFRYVSNFYSFNGASNLQSYVGAIRFQSTTPASLNVVVQPNQPFSLVFYVEHGIRSMTSITNMEPYPCTSNIPIRCTWYQGNVGSYNQIFMLDRVVVTFLDTSYGTTPFHIIVPDLAINMQTKTIYYFGGSYNILTKDWSFVYANSITRYWNSWSASPTGVLTAMRADITGRAGSYRRNVSVSLFNNAITTGGTSFLLLSTQWSFFQNPGSTLSTATMAMTTPARFGTNNMAPVSTYMINGMYLTVIPFIYTANSNFTFFIDNAHMPYSYDLPSYYIYIAEQSAQNMVSSNQFVMTNGGTLYQSPLQSLTVICQDNAVGVVSTYCNINFGTSNPLLAAGNIRVSLSGLTVATDICFLTSLNGTSIPVTCTSSTDNLNVTAALSGGIGFYPAGNYTLVIYGVGITSNSLSQSMTLYLYDQAIQYAIETGVRILTTTISSVSQISLNQIMYSYLSPLSYNKMTIQFYLPRMLYKDEQFAFVIGQDLSDVNTQVARLNIIITKQDGTVLYPLFSIDNINYLIVFSFTDPAQLTVGSYMMTIFGICTPASQANGAFNMIYRRTYDFTYTIVNSANVIFPTLNALITSNISLTSFFNTEGYKQQVDFTIVNLVLNVDQKMVWIINFPSYYSPQLFQTDAYCMIDTAVIDCVVDPNTPYQLIVSNSPKMVNAGIAYKISVIGLAGPRNPYTNNAYPSRYIFVGVLQNSASSAYAERALLLPYQSVQSMVTGIVNVQNMVGVSATSLYAFSSIYAQFQLLSNVAITSGSFLYIDLPIQFDNLNNIALNAILINGATIISSSAQVINRRIEISITANIAASTSFIVQFPNLPTPKSPCSSPMSEMIVTVTPSNKLSVYAASSVQGNSAPTLSFIQNSRYISFNNDQTITITAGTYSSPISITASDGNAFLSNININLTSTGFLFIPNNVFLPIGVKKQTFIIGADTSLLPVVYFYQGIKQEQVNTNYQITLNMNIRVTNNPVTITLPSSLTLPKGGCTNPFLIFLSNPPFQDLTISYTFDNALYSQNDFYPNPLTTQSQMSFNSTNSNSTFSFCSSSNLNASQIPLTFYLSGSNYNSYQFSPSNQIMVNIVPGVASVAPVISLELKNQQKTFLDVNFTNNVDGLILYQMMIGQNMTPLDIQSMQVYIKSNIWVLQSLSSFMNHIKTTDIDNRIGQFFQAASTTTVRISNLLPQTFYTLCAYLINVYGVTSNVTCLQLSTMAWGTMMKATIRFTKTLTAQQLNNILCFFTISAATSQGYLIDMQGNSCGNRAVTNIYYRYQGTQVKTQSRGTNIYLFTNPYITGTDPAPLAFTNLFNALDQLSIGALSSAQSLFAINFLSATYVTSFNSRLMSSPSQAQGLITYFDTPTYNSTSQILTVNNVQIVGNVGTIYFVLVLYKKIVSFGNGSTAVNIRMNSAPNAQQVLNCQNWQGDTAQGCSRAIYTGVSSLTVTFPNVQTDSLYMLYYMPATQFPLRPIVTGQVYSQTIVTYSSQLYVKLIFLSAFMLLVLLVA